MMTELDKMRIIALKEQGLNEHEIAVDFFHRKFPLQYALMRKEIQICLEVKP